MNRIKKFFLFLYKIIIGDDIKTVKYIIKQVKEDKPILDPEKKRIAIQEMKKLPAVLFKESWYWILAVIFAFAMGSLVGYQYAEMECNNFIIENYGVQVINHSSADYNVSNFLPVISPGVPVLDSDESHETSES